MHRETTKRFGLPAPSTNRRIALVKTVALAELSTRRVELLDGLTHGETFAVTDEGREVATLSPLHTVGAQDGEGTAFDLVADLIGMADGPPNLSDKKKHLANFGLDNERP